MRYRCWILVSLLFVGFFSVAQTPENREFQIKAAFIFNFTQFVQWPTDAFADAGAPLVIGILGEDPFGTYLTETIEGEKVNGHLLTVQHFKSIDEVKNCQILFINLPDADKLQEALTAIKGKSILTVSDMSAFIKMGGMIHFITRDNKIQIQVNPDAAKSTGLVLSSKLLRVAEVITPKQSN